MHSNKTIFLTAANNEIDCQAICDLLRGEGIPTLRKYRGADSFLMLYMGGHNEPIEIHVPEKAVERALSLIEFYDENKEEVPLDDIISWNQRPRYHVRALLVLFYVVPMVAVLIFQFLD